MKVNPRHSRMSEVRNQETLLARQQAQEYKDQQEGQQAKERLDKIK